MYKKEALELHKKGKLEVKSKIKLTSGNLRLAYTPGVAEVSKEIYKHPRKIFDYTIKRNCVAIVTDGSAVLGLGNIGAEASLPVMEGKAVIFKEFAGIDAFPICLKTQKVNEIVNIVKNISTVFGGINLEDISAPRCFEVEGKLQNLGIPVMHDDQHGTAVVVLAGLINSCKVVKKRFEDLKIVVNGAGAAGTAISRLLSCTNIHDKICKSVSDIIVCDRHGTIYEGRKNLNKHKMNLAKNTNRTKIKGKLIDALEGADVFIGVSTGNLLNEEMIKKMNKNSIVFAMANPVPEIMPEKARKAGAKIVATGRSDFSNQINNALAFPGIFRGALDSGAKQITDKMKLNAAYALANAIRKPNQNRILPDLFDKSIVKNIARAIMKD